MLLFVHTCVFLCVWGGSGNSSWVRACVYVLEVFVCACLCMHTCVGVCVRPCVVRAVAWVEIEEGVTQQCG